MYFNTKNYLKSNHKYPTIQTLNQKQLQRKFYRIHKREENHKAVNESGRHRHVPIDRIPLLFN